MNRKIAVLFLNMLLCMGILGGVAFGAPETDELYRQGHEAYMAQDYGRAFECFSRTAEEGNAVACER